MRKRNAGTRLSDNKRLLLEFVGYLKDAGLTIATIEQYTSALGRYGAFLQPGGLLTGTRDSLSAFLETLYADGVSEKSMAFFLAALRQLYRFGISMRYTHEDLTVGFPRSWKAFHSVPVATVRAIVPRCRPNAPIIEGFHCSECEWSYVMPDPKPYLITPEDAERAGHDFDGHCCDKFQPRNKEALVSLPMISSFTNDTESTPHAKTRY